MEGRITKNKIKAAFTARNLALFVFYMLSFLFGLGFFGLDNILLLLLIVLVLIRQFSCNRIRLQKGIFLVLGFSFSLLLFYEIHYAFAIKDLFYFIFFPIGCYLVGSSLATKNENIKIENEKYIFKFLFAVSLGLVTRALLGTILTIQYYGLFSNERLFLDIWNYGKSFTSATGVNAFVLLSSAVALPVILIKNNYKRWYHIVLSIFSFLFSIYLTLVLQNRTGILVIGLCIILFPFFLMLSDFKRYKKLFLILVSLLLVFLTSFVLIYNFSSSFREKINAIPIFKRLFNFNETSYSERLELYKVFFSNMFKYPFGGMTSPKGGLIDVWVGYTKFDYVHNTWLDFYKLGGIFPCLFFILISLSIIKNQLDYMIFSKDSFFKMFITEIIIAMFGLFFFEPIFEANIYFFVIIFFVFGIVERLSNNYALSHISFSQYSAINQENYKIVFISNFLSLHQRELHDALCREYGERYHFISLQAVPNEHQIYGSSQEHPANEVKKYESLENEKFAEELIKEADVILYGSVPDKELRYARKKGKILIQLSERLYKESKHQRWRIRSLLSELKHIAPYESKYQTFCFTLSAYTSYDYELVNHAIEKCLSWAYWVKDIGYSDFSSLLEKKKTDKIHILFVNRLIEWKHPEKAVLLAEYLQNHGIQFDLDIIGTGEQEINLQKMIAERGLDEYVHLSGRLSNQEVRERMEGAHILISTSDQNEGWGACVNEGMISGCAVVASHTTGSAPVLIENGSNGFIYDFYDDTDLFEKVLLLCKNETIRNSIAEKAFLTMKTEYNATQSVIKLDAFIKGLIHHELIFQDKGILSKSYQRNEEYYRTRISHQYGECQAMIGLQKEQDENVIINKEEKPASLKKGAIISYLAIFLNIIAGLLYTPWMIRELGQSNYGIYSLASSMIALFAVDLGLGTAVSRFVAKYRAEKDEKSANKMTGLIFKCFIVITAVLLVALTIIYFCLPNIYKKLTPEEISSLRIVYIMVGLYSSVCFVFTPLNGILIGNNKFPEYKVITLVGRVINIALVVISLLMNSNLYLFVLAIIIAGLIELILKWIVVRKKCEYGASPLLKYNDKQMLDTLLKFSFWAAISSIASRYIISINPSILGIFSGTAQIAIFTLGSTIEGYTWQFANGLDGMFIPRLSEMNDRNATPEEYTKLMIKIGRLQLLFTGLIIVGFMSLGRSFINDIWKLRKDDSISYDPSYFVAIFMLIPCFITFTQEIGNTTLIVKNKVKYNGIATIITACVTVALSFLLCYLFPEQGAICAGIAILVGKTIGNIIYMNIIYKKILNLNLKEFYLSCHARIMPFLIITLLFGLLVEFLIPTNGLLYFGIKVILVCIFYFILCWNFVLNKSEKEIIIHSLNRLENLMKKTDISYIERESE